MKLQIAKGSINQIITVFIQDNTATDGSGLGSLDQTSSIVGGYVRAGATGLALAVDQNVTTEGTYEAPTTDNQVRIGTPANMTAGTYELHLHNDLLATGADSVFITLGGASNMAVLVIEIQLTDLDAKLDRNADLVESQNAHIWQGNYFYVDPANGNDSTGTGTRALPYATIQAAHDDLVTESNHDVIFLVAGASGGATTHTIASTTTISKRNCLIRGPGRNFIITRTGAGDTLAITGDGVEIAGVQIGTAGTGSGDGIDITDADFVGIHKCWFLATQGDGVHILRGSNCRMHDNHFEGTGAGGSGQGIHISGTAGASSSNMIHNNHFANTGGDSIRIENGTTNDTAIHHNVIHNAGGWGINIGDSSTDAQVHDNVFGNNTSGNITDAGTNTIQANNEQWAKAGAAADDLDDLPTAAEIVDEWETQSQADPTGFHVNVREWLDTAVTLSGSLPDVNIERLDAAVKQDISQIVEKSGGTVWYVDQNAADDNGDGLTPDTPRQAVKTVIEAASAGDMVVLLGGDHDIGNNAILVPAGVYLRGMGMYLSTIQSQYPTASGAILVPTSGCQISDLTSEGNLYDGTPQIPLGADQTTGDAPFVDVLIERVQAKAEEDGLFVLATSGEWNCILRDCVLTSEFTTLAAGAIGGATIRFWLERCTLHILSGFAHNLSGVLVATGDIVITMHDCTIDIQHTGAQDATGINTLGGRVTMVDGSIRVSSSSGTATSIKTTSPGFVSLSNVDYDSTITSGNGTLRDNEGAILGDTNELQQDDIPGLIAALKDFDPANDAVANVTLVDTTTVVTNKTGYSLTTGERNSITDAVLVRGASNIEDTADRHSLGACIMIMTNSVIAATTLTAKKPSDDSPFATYTVTVDANADPLTGVS